MYERAKAINKYYTDLKYNVISKKQAKTIINLHKDIQLKDIKNLSERFFETASIIEQNLSLFASLCKHIDIVTALVEYLNYYGAQFMFNEEYDEAETVYKEHYIPGTLILTVYSMCREEALITFLEHAIIEDTALVMGEILTHVKFMIDDSSKENMLLM
ncbi:unnamed protein product [Lasius platythorax]|uniref:Uncharacterized protein n=1 Tax=Lasius platythorax TaxID=488582 RepID=A0AAV2NMM3_9HYME